MNIDEIMSFEDIIEYLDAVKYDLTPGDDITLTTPEYDFTFYLWWHSPSLNLNWYPIVQVDNDTGIIFNREGTENPDNWYRVIDQAIDKIIQTYDVEEELADDAYVEEYEDDYDPNSYGQHSEDWYIARDHGEDTEPFV